MFHDAVRVNDAAHEFELVWLDSPHQNYVAINPQVPERALGVIQVVDSSNLVEEYGDAHISLLAVDDGFRCNGLGALLITHAVEMARESGFAVISTHPTSDASARLFARQGFVAPRQSQYVPYFRFLDLNAQKES